MKVQVSASENKNGMSSHRLWSPKYWRPEIVLSCVGVLALLMAWRDISSAGHSPECRMTWALFRLRETPVLAPAGEDREAWSRYYHPYRLVAFEQPSRTRINDTDGRRLPPLEGDNEEDTLELKGTPVLFIPGHMGSSRQARSLFSHSKTKQTSLQYYALDFAGEGSAFYGDRLWRQARFVNAAIRTLQSLHGIQGQKGGVILVGHSFGGVVARAALVLQGAPEDAVSLVLTLGSPHVRAPWTLDASMDDLYHHLHTYYMHAGVGSARLIGHPPDLRRGRRGSQPLASKDAVLVSIMGGQRDSLVGPQLGNVTGKVPSSRSMTLSTTAINGVGFEVDHLALLWCNQLTHRLTITLNSTLSTPPSSLLPRLRAALLSSSPASPPPSLTPFLLPVTLLLRDEAQTLLPLWLTLCLILLSLSYFSLRPPSPLLLLPAALLAYAAHFMPSHSPLAPTILGLHLVACIMTLVHQGFCLLPALPNVQRRLLLTPIFLLLPAIPVALVLMPASAYGLNPTQALLPALHLYLACSVPVLLLSLLLLPPPSLPPSPRATNLLLLLPSLLPLLSQALASIDLLLRPLPPSLHAAPPLRPLLWTLLITLSLLYTLLFPRGPPPASTYHRRPRASIKSHASCTVCLHPDGGPEAEFVETKVDRVRISKDVCVGPGFRVSWCDCSRQPNLPILSYCEFCLCRCSTCGGSPLARAHFVSRAYAGGSSDPEDQPWDQELTQLWDGCKHPLAALILGFLAMLTLGIGLTAPYHVVPITAVAMGVMCVVGPPPLIPVVEKRQPRKGGKTKVQ